MQKRTFGAFTKVWTAAVLGFAFLVAPCTARGANVTYLPNAQEGGIYDWRTVGNWFTVNGGALDGLPGTSDKVWVTNTTFATDWLVIPSEASVSVRALYLQQKSVASRYGVKVKIDGGSLATTADSYIGYQGNDAVLAIENSGIWTATNNVFLGYGGGTNCHLQVASGGTFIGQHMTVGHGGASHDGSLIGSVENEGNFSLTGTLTIGNRPNNGETSGVTKFENSGTATVDGTVYVGRTLKSNATLVNHAGAGMTVNDINLGAWTNATGRILNDGTLTVTTTSTVGFGTDPGSNGELVNYGTLNLSAGQLNLGRYGRARLETGSDMSVGRLFLGVQTGGRGELCVTNGATLTTTDGRMTMANAASSTALMEIFEDSTLVGATNLVVGSTGFGILRLQGGTVTLTDDVGAWMSIGQNSRTADVSNGRLEGWGTINKTEPNQATGTHWVQMNLYNGIVQADGFGAARDLDFRLVQNMNHSSAAPNTCGTNGWYAVNGARLRYPARFHSGGTARIVGDYGSRSVTEANLPLVNSFGVTFGSNILANQYLYADLYANDRSDIPDGLPEAYPGSSALGVWRAALSGNKTEPKASNETSFGSADILVHYDGAAFAKLKKNGTWPGDLKLALYAHDGTAEGHWRRVAFVDPSDSPYISATITESSDTWNMGWFAVVPVKKNGLIITFR